MTDASTARKAKVFISYSRDDIAFADQLVAALEGTGFDPLIDRHSIPGGEDWKAQLRHMIVEADSVVFVLSPRSAASKLYEWEVEEADQLNKRVIPIVCASLEGISVPPRLANRNYIYFYAEPKETGSGLLSGLARLVAALNTDLDWIRDHTRLGAALLLRGDELEDAERWLARKPSGAPEPTDLLRAFLAESRRAEAARLDNERRQLAAIAAAQAAEKNALANIAISGHDSFVRSAAFSPDGSRHGVSGHNRTYLGCPPRDDVTESMLAEACKRLAGRTEFTHDEMRLAGYPDDAHEIDVCQ